MSFKKGLSLVFVLVMACFTSGCLERQRDMSLTRCSMTYFWPAAEAACEKGVQIGYEISNATWGNGKPDGMFTSGTLKCYKLYTNPLLAAACVDGVKKFRGEAMNLVNAQSPENALALRAPADRDEHIETIYGSKTIDGPVENPAAKNEATKLIAL